MGTTALLVPLDGEVLIRHGDHEEKVTVGVVVLLDQAERVSLVNQTNEPASLLAVFAPADSCAPSAAGPPRPSRAPGTEGDISFGAGSARRLMFPDRPPARTAAVRRHRDIVRGRRRAGRRRDCCGVDRAWRLGSRLPSTWPLLLFVSSSFSAAVLKRLTPRRSNRCAAAGVDESRAQSQAIRWRFCARGASAETSRDADPRIVHQTAAGRRPPLAGLIEPFGRPSLV